MPGRDIVPVQPRRHGDVRLDAKARGLEALHEPDCSPLFVPVEAFGEQQGESGVQRCRQARCAHQELAEELEAQRRASQQGIRIGTDGAHKAQGLAVGADQYVLPVVHGEAVDLHGAGAAAEYARRLENLDPFACGGQFDSGRKPGVSRPDNCDLQAVIQVLPASQSLRSGGREMRWSSTRKPSRTISSRVAP